MNKKDFLVMIGDMLPEDISARAVRIEYYAQDSTEFLRASERCELAQVRHNLQKTFLRIAYNFEESTCMIEVKA